MFNDTNFVCNDTASENLWVERHLLSWTKVLKNSGAICGYAEASRDLNVRALGSVSENQNEEESDHLSHDYDIWLLELNGFEYPFDAYEGTRPS